MFFFFNDTATTEIYTLSLHDALPICVRGAVHQAGDHQGGNREIVGEAAVGELDVLDAHRVDRKSTRLNSSHDQISYAVFCLKKKKTRTTFTRTVSWSRMKGISTPRIS